jgi:hypothetical protein
MDVTARTGLAGPASGFGCVWRLITGGYVDLFVTNYVDFTARTTSTARQVGAFARTVIPMCTILFPASCTTTTVMGRFIDITKAAGVYRTDGNGLGVVFGITITTVLTDIYVANDSVQLPFP